VVLPRPQGDPAQLVRPAHHAVAVVDGAYVGLVRVTGTPRLPRIGLVAVRADHQRRGIATALLDHALTALHDAGTTTASAEVSEANRPATALFTAIGARHHSTNLELQLH
jgi:ribosomal protein S18 acetylase RimI-like enzyme